MRKLWGGRFEGSTDELIERLNNSLSFDSRLWRQDIRGSIAHARMLGDTGVIGPAESAEIVAGLELLRSDLEAGAAALPPDAEDIHSAVEGLLRDRIGPLAGKLHTARSRNDQVATDLRLYLRDASDSLRAELLELQALLLQLAEREADSVLPGFTHLQHAQPVVLGHHLLAYFWMFDRDVERLDDARRRINRSPLGAAALAGTGFPIDREQTRRELGFESALPNSLDAVSDRDFAAEFLAVAAILMMHVSRLAEEIVLWNSPEFGYVTLHDSVTTGSSIMPQKKNPDVAELARGKTGRVYGDLVALLTVLKGLPLAYNKDLQEDKEPVFDAVDTLALVLPSMRRTLETAQFRRDKMRAASQGDFSTATDLADLLVRRGLPFRDAHEIVGRLVRHCLDNGTTLEALDSNTLSAIADLPLDDPDAVLAALRVDSSVAARTSYGGTAPSQVRAQVALARGRLAGRLAANGSDAGGSPCAGA